MRFEESQFKARFFSKFTPLNCIDAKNKDPENLIPLFIKGIAKFDKKTQFTVFKCKKLSGSPDKIRHLTFFIAALIVHFDLLKPCGQW